MQLMMDFVKSSQEQVSSPSHLPTSDSDNDKDAGIQQLQQQVASLSKKLADQPATATVPETTRTFRQTALPFKRTGAPAGN